MNGILNGRWMQVEPWERDYIGCNVVEGLQAGVKRALLLSSKILLTNQKTSTDLPSPWGWMIHWPTAGLFMHLWEIMNATGPGVSSWRTHGNKMKCCCTSFKLILFSLKKKINPSNQGIQVAIFTRLFCISTMHLHVSRMSDRAMSTQLDSLLEPVAFSVVRFTLRLRWRRDS